MTITFYGQNCFLLEIGGKKLLSDPFISHNPNASHINVDEIRCDYLLITHAHGDHVADVERIAANNPDASLIGIAELAGYYGAKKLKTMGMNKGGWVNMDFGRIRQVQAVHSSSFPDGTYGGEPVGYVIDAPDGVLYMAGDTALTLDMQLIPMVSPHLNIAILPIGSHYTMDYHDALLASDFIQCNRVIGCHYDTFPPIKINREEAVKAFSDKQKELILLEIGASIEITKG